MSWVWAGIRLTAKGLTSSAPPSSKGLSYRDLPAMDPSLLAAACSAPRSAGRGGQDQGHSGVGAAQNDRKEKRQRTQQPSCTSALALFIVYFPRRPTRRKRRRSRSRRAYLPPPPPHRPWRLERAWGDQNFSGLRVDLSPVPSVRQLLPFSFRHPSKCQTHHRPLFGFAAPATPSG